MYEENNKKSLLKTILYSIFMGIFLFIMCAIIVRSCQSIDSPIADDVIFDDITKKAYNDSPEDFKVITYDLEKRFEAVEANQLLQLKFLYFIPSAKQMQITIKYNISYAKPATDTFLPFDLILKNDSGDILNDYFYEHDEKDGFAYIRIAWNNVEFTDKSEYTLQINQKKEGKTVTRGTFLIQKGSTAHQDTPLTKDIAPYIFSKK